MIEAAARHGLRVVAAGAPVPGHDEELRALHQRAERHGVELVVTGTLERRRDGRGGPRGDRAGGAERRGQRQRHADDLARVRAASPRRRTASTPRSSTAAIPARCTSTPDAAALPAAVEAALADPSRTRLDHDPGVPDAGAEHAALYRRILGVLTDVLVPGNRFDLLDGYPVPRPRVSVVVAHYRQPAQLARTWAALCHQSLPRSRSSSPTTGPTRRRIRRRAARRCAW